MVLRILVLLLLTTLAVFSAAQDVREQTSLYGSLRAAGERAAERAGFAPWPKLRQQETGTQVHVTFDYRNADVILLTNPNPGRAKLEAIGRRIAAAMNAPKADFIFAPDRTYGSVDIEFNDYLIRRDNTHSFRIDLARLADALRSEMDLANPIAIRIDAEDADHATVLRPGQASTTIKQNAFFAPDELPAGSTAELSASVGWQAYAGAASLIALAISFTVMLAWLPWQPLFSRKPLETPTASNLTTGDASKPWNSKLLLIYLKTVLPVVGVAVVVLSLKHASRVLPLELLANGRFMFVAPFAFVGGIFGTSMLAYKLYVRSRARLDPAFVDPMTARITVDASEDLANRSLRLMFIPIGLMLLLIVLFSVIGPIDYRVKAAFIWTIFAGGFLTVGLLARRLRQANVATLSNDDPIAIAAFELGRRAGIRVRKVEKTKSDLLSVNRTLLGTVVVSKGLIEKLDGDEVRALLAREIGKSHTRFFAITVTAHLAVMLPLVVGMSFIRRNFAHLAPPPFDLLLRSSPVIHLVPISLLSGWLIERKARNHEFQADLCAVRLVGDAELVIRAITKVHALGQTPQGPKSAEAVTKAATILESRIAAIRAAASAR